MSQKFANKVVVITGGSDGIGLATAKRFATEGAQVYVTARRQEPLDRAVSEIGHDAIGIQGDVADPTSLDRLYQRIMRDHGRIDVLFANAGISESAPLDTIDDAHIERVFSVNVKGTLFTVQKALPLMTPGSSVILTGSVAGSKGIASLSVYSATKAAIRSFARTWTTDLKARGIRVNVVSPGMILTPAMQAYLQANDGMEEALINMTPFGRLGEVDEVARAVLFLASEDSEFIAGDELFVDGGIMAV
ncbi:oxidoreductase [Superficieibacter electus]|uniref:Oxidoreductase n=1 Tax=Superficieibacter electus TaxID=2022662 RepID=A0A2P5GUW9_9ENTR|nr:glucose 1-dehydrogenase [Superficieibacter electus]POP44350.1 oxidoreductase [Superficieibacter electus]POP50368.1 oxidoreductase [Superficieibacter electus]